MQVKRPSRLILMIAVTIVTFAAYWPALHGAFIWDDDRHVSENHTLLTVRGLKHIWLDPQYLPQWYPLTHTTFWIERQFFGLDTLGYHIDNVLLHLANALLVWLLLRSLNLRGAALAAIIFALHPVEVESVAWISERKNLLSTFFALLSMLMYRRSDRVRDDVAALLLFTLAMLSKTVACSVPAVLLVLILWEHRRVTINDLVRLVPYFVIGGVLAVFTAWTEKHHVGAAGKAWELTAADRCMIAGRAVWFYAGKLLVPINLMFSYPRWQVGTGLIFLIALLALLAGLWLAKKYGSLAMAVIFIGVLVPALGFIDTYPMQFSFVADHFQYAAGIALIAGVAELVTRYVFNSRTLTNSVESRLTAAGPRSGDSLLPAIEATARRTAQWREVVVITIIAIPLAILTFQRAAVFAGPVPLWNDVIAKNPQSWLARENLAVFYSLTGKPTEALPLFAQVESLKPDHEMVHVNWGDALYQLGRWSEAIDQYALASESHKVNPATLHDRIGDCRAHLGQTLDAVAEWRIALTIDPTDAEASNRLAEMLVASGDEAGALALCDRLLNVSPDQSDALRLSGEILLHQHRPSQALPRLERSVADGNENNRLPLLIGEAYLQLNRPSDAIGPLSHAASMDPQNQEAQRLLAEALAKSR